MRISDWSSDVCSSDLVEFGQLGRPFPGFRRVDGRKTRRTDRFEERQRIVAQVDDFGLDIVAAGGRDHPHRQLHAAAGADRPADRKSVVEGKSVSVRVDLGGRRIIKKKKNKTDK